MASAYKQAKREAKEFKRMMNLAPLISMAPTEVFKKGRKARQLYEEIILHDPKLCETKHIERMMWKDCFYIYITELRAHLSSIAAKCGATSSGAGNSANPARSAPKSATKSKVEAAMRRPRQKLAAFIDLASAYYQEMMVRFKALGAKDKVDRSKSVQRILVYLGDLARYKSRETDDGRCSNALQFYLKAVQVFPHDGNPHNQLAVLATYQNFSLNAVYHYCRALATRFPFYTARDNLERLFHKEVPRAVGLAEDEITLKRHWRDCSQSGQSINHSYKGKMRRLLMSRFVQFHGSLLMKGTSNVGALVSDLARIKGSMSELVSRCFSQNLLHHGIVLKMIVISIFTILDLGRRKQENDILIDFAWEAFALILRLTAAFIVGDASSLDNLAFNPNQNSKLRQRGKNKDKIRDTFSLSKPQNMSMLRPIFISAQWIHVLHKNKTGSSLGWGACPVPIQRIVLRSLVSVVNWSKVTELLSGSVDGSASLPENPILPEVAELVGWQPLQSVESCNGEIPISSSEPSCVLEEPHAMRLRCRLLRGIMMELACKPGISEEQPSIHVQYLKEQSLFSVKESRIMSIGGRGKHKGIRGLDKTKDSSLSSDIARPKQTPHKKGDSSNVSVPLPSDVTPPDKTTLLSFENSKSRSQVTSSAMQTSHEYKKLNISLQEDDGEDEILLECNSGLYGNTHQVWSSDASIAKYQAYSHNFNQWHHPPAQQTAQYEHHKQMYGNPSWNPHAVWQLPGSMENVSVGMRLDNSEWEAVENILEEVLKDPFLQDGT